MYASPRFGAWLPLVFLVRSKLWQRYFHFLIQYCTVHNSVVRGFAPVQFCAELGHLISPLPQFVLRFYALGVYFENVTDLV
ncbi:hypothetical protein HS088_TW20G00256 [Tripterygium wilfordii]|uniref:Uncharacterized protein n=1 Tax=Tripterygium wilfordii TaxID=458696 RepID=A0A7J7C707_TRIWF|nr:hypothetical protein HS088_TW20G00256 [Tripterygium wilfordii]